jgi:hypothetical protein
MSLHDLQIRKYSFKNRFIFTATLLVSLAIDDISIYLPSDLHEADSRNPEPDEVIYIFLHFAPTKGNSLLTILFMFIFYAPANKNA